MQATSFNSELVWDTSKVTSMVHTFGLAYAFNQPLVWDTSKATSMQKTFELAYAFNQPLAWDTSKVAYFNNFGQCAALAPSNPNC